MKDSSQNKRVETEREGGGREVWNTLIVLIHLETITFDSLLFEAPVGLVCNEFDNRLRRHLKLQTGK